MEKDRAAEPANARAQVPIEHADHVIEMIVAPHRLMARGRGKPDRAIVAAVAGVFAPAVIGAHGLRGQGRAWTWKAVAPDDQPLEAEPASGGRAVAFALHMGDAASAQRAWKLQRAAAQDAPVPRPRR